MLNYAWVSTDIKFKMKYFELEKLELPGPPPVLSPRPIEGTPQMPACFSKTAMPKFHLDMSLFMDGVQLPQG